MRGLFCGGVGVSGDEKGMERGRGTYSIGMVVVVVVGRKEWWSTGCRNFDVKFGMKVRKWSEGVGGVCDSGFRVNNWSFFGAFCSCSFWMFL